MSSPVTFKVGNSVMDTRLIILDSKLGEHSCLVREDHFVLMECHFTAYGDSGAWVVHNGKLCGHVIGGKGDLPWAYMVPIRRIMAEIKLAFGTDNVCLPKNVNEFPTTTMRQEPNSEANIETYDNENFP